MSQSKPSGSTRMPGCHTEEERNVRLADLQRTVNDGVAMPFWSYTDTQFHAWEVQKLFHSDWVFGCFSEEVRNPGDYYSFTVANEPIVILRDANSELRALSNACRHRGTLLVEGSGNAERFVCPYHSWTYNQRGELVAVPFADKSTFNTSSHCLPSFRVEEWNEMIFVSFNQEVEPLESRLQGVTKHLGSDFFPGFKRNRVSRNARHAHKWNTNWKIVAENALDSYHIFSVHPKTLQPYAPTKDIFFVEGNNRWTLSGLGKECAKIHQKGRLGEVGTFSPTNFLILSLPPSFALLISTDWVLWQIVDPISVNRAMLHTGIVNNPSLSYFSYSKAERKFLSNFQKATDEDFVVLDKVQRGAEARQSQSGVLVPGMEDAVIHFHKYIASNLLSRLETENHED